MSKFDVDEALVRKLAGLLKDTGLAEIEFESEGKRIRVNTGAVGAVHVPVAAAAPAAAAPAALAAAPASGGGVPAGALTSPMVGTAYLAPEPGAAPFVKAGDRVNKGQTVLIIEAMKVMNPIQAPVSGTVKDILIADGQPVEFGEAMMIIQ
ncbi:acetyl-CoA carboxylase biotin carboxyl carrier protein [Dongia sp.]|uniref:acetyl-CoA carboxylase biotin carboxyl carrier protein n=1 Tax=Dongia sp. TaxID=1977262 RepID=UPI003750EBCC